MTTLKYKIFEKYPVKNIPSKHLFALLPNPKVMVELIRRGWDMKRITAQKEGV